MGISKQCTRHDIRKYQWHEACEKAEDKEMPGVFLQTLKIHLKTSEEHDIIYSHTAEYLEGNVALKDVESVIAYHNTSKHHSDDMGNAQFTHHDRCEEDNQKHHEEDQRGVGDGQICGNHIHFECKGSAFFGKKCE